jgi:hypothetical protein
LLWVLVLVERGYTRRRPKKESDEPFSQEEPRFEAGLLFDLRSLHR